MAALALTLKDTISVEYVYSLPLHERYPFLLYLGWGDKDNILEKMVQLNETRIENALAETRRILDSREQSGG